MKKGLTHAETIQVRELLKDGDTNEKLASDFKVSEDYIEKLRVFFGLAKKEEKPKAPKKKKAKVDESA